MPIFMDRHNVPGIEAKAAAEAHRADMLVQDEFGCRCMTYWVDEDRGNAFCLIDAPNMDAVVNMHNKAHGLVSNEIIQVNSNVVEAFLGRIQDPKGYADANDSTLKIFNDPAFRIILITEVSDPILLNQKFGKDKASQLMLLYNDMMREQIDKYEGREAENEGHGFISSFISVTQAVNCAIAIQKGLHVAGELMHLRIGINAGMPIDKSKELFGETVKMAKYLCQIGKENEIMMASIIREIYKNNLNNISTSKKFKWIEPIDENSLQLLFDTLWTNYQNPSFDLQAYCEFLSMSKSKLYRKCKLITGLSPNVLIREFRLTRSLDLMKTGRTISQITFDSGFSSPSYFTKCFLKRFGTHPFTYQKNLL